MRTRKGFNIIELIIAAMIIATLISIAIPSYRSAKEASIASKAYENLNMIRTAQAIYISHASNYITDTNQLQNYGKFSTNDGNWTYTIPFGAGNQFTANAQRQQGRFRNYNIRLDQSANITYTDNNGNPLSQYPP